MSAEESADSSGAAIPARWLFRQFWPLARPNRAVMALACLPALVSAGAEAAVVLVFMAITDRALVTKELSAFWRPA